MEICVRHLFNVVSGVMQSILLLVSVVHSFLILEGLSKTQLDKISVLHAFISPVISPITVDSDTVCVPYLRSGLLNQLGMIGFDHQPSLTFKDFCSMLPGRTSLM